MAPCANDIANALSGLGFATGVNLGTGRLLTSAEIDSLPTYVTNDTALRDVFKTRVVEKTNFLVRMADSVCHYVGQEIWRVTPPNAQTAVTLTLANPVPTAFMQMVYVDPGQGAPANTILPFTTGWDIHFANYLLGSMELPETYTLAKDDPQASPPFQVESVALNLVDGAVTLPVGFSLNVGLQSVMMCELCMVFSYLL